MVGGFVAGLACFVVLILMALASRVYPTIWLPITLAALVGVLLCLLPNPGQLRELAWAGIGCGAILLWKLSEPESPVFPVSGLKALGLLLAAVCAVSLASLLAKGFGGEREAAFRWAALVVAMSWLIAFFSSPKGGSGGMLDFAMHRFGLTPEQAEVAVKAVRKTIHFSFYGLLGWSGYRLALSLGKGARMAAFFGLALTCLHACYDESRQTFFSSRTGSGWDVLLDLSGAVVLIGVGLYRAGRRGDAVVS